MPDMEAAQQWSVIRLYTKQKDHFFTSLVNSEAVPAILDSVLRERTIYYTSKKGTTHVFAGGFIKHMRIRSATESDLKRYAAGYNLAI